MGRVRNGDRVKRGWYLGVREGGLRGDVVRSGGWYDMCGVLTVNIAH